jgi:hypothetical protein
MRDPLNVSFGVVSLLVACALSACRDPELKTPDHGGRAANTARDAEPTMPSAVSTANVFFFGHSLVGHDMPQMIGSLARARNKTYSVHGQIGFGTPLMSHWRWHGSFDSGFIPAGFPDELRGALLFDVEGHAALESGAYDVVVLTETNGFATGSPGHWSTTCDPNNDFGGCTIDNLVNLVRLARQHNEKVRPFFYANWKDVEELGGIEPWRSDAEGTLGWWEHVADQAEVQLTREGVRGAPIRVVPVGTIIARIVREAEAGQLAALGLPNRAPLFRDSVHLSALGFYIVALTHYAVIYRDSPLDLPAVVDVVADDKKAIVPGGLTVDPRLARHFQEVVAAVLKDYPRAGL